MNEPFKTAYKTLFYLLCITYQSVVFIAMRGAKNSLKQNRLLSQLQTKKLEQAFSLPQSLSRLVLCSLIQYQFKSLLLLFVCSSNHQ